MAETTPDAATVITNNPRRRRAKAEPKAKPQASKLPKRVASSNKRLRLLGDAIFALPQKYLPGAYRPRRKGGDPYLPTDPAHPDYGRTLAFNAQKPRLAAAERAARDYFRDHFRMYEVSEDGPVTTFTMFGGLAILRVDRLARQTTISTVSWVRDLSKSLVEKMSYDPATARFVFPEEWEQRTMTQGSSLLPLFLLPTFRSDVHPLLMSLARALVKAHLDASAGTTPVPEGTTEQQRNEAISLVVKHGFGIARKLVNSCWGKSISLPKAYRTVAKVAWQQLDPESVRLAISACGRKATLFQYNEVWANVEEFSRLHPVSPGLLPLWLGSLRFRLDRARAEQRELTSRDPNPVRTVQDWLASLGGVTPRGWRRLISLSPTYLRHLMSPDEESRRWGPTDMARLLSDVDPLPPVTVWRRFASYERNDYIRDVREDWIVREATAILSSVGRESRRGKGKIKNFYWKSFQPVLDWHIDHVEAVRRGRERPLDRNQLNAGWGLFWRKQDQWHRDAVARREAAARAAREQAERERAAREARRAAGLPDLDAEGREVLSHPVYGQTYRWSALVPRVEHGDYEAVALTTSEALSEEGKAMHHCVAGYDSYCAANATRIFSVRRDGKRVTTLEISTTPLISRTEWVTRPAGSTIAPVPLGDVTWRARQNRGVLNAEVPDTEAIADRVARAYTAAFAALDPVERCRALMPLYNVHEVAEDGSERPALGAAPFAGRPAAVRQRVIEGPERLVPAEEFAPQPAEAARVVPAVPDPNAEPW